MPSSEAPPRILPSRNSFQFKTSMPGSRLGSEIPSASDSSDGTSGNFQCPYNSSPSTSNDDHGTVRNSSSVSNAKLEQCKEEPRMRPQNEHYNEVLNISSPKNALEVDFASAKDLVWSHDLFDESMKAAGLTGVETGTKLYISNLDYGVSNEDIKELFSEMGVLKKSTVHYDKNGRSTGTAEVVFMRRSDAVGALKRYNNVQLDGKAMKIEIIGDNLGLPIMPRISVAGGANGRGRRTVVMTPEFGRGRGPRGGRGGARPFNRTAGSTRGSFSQRGRGRGRIQQRGSRGGFGGRVRGKKREVSVKDLDKDLDTYHNDAMITS